MPIRPALALRFAVDRSRTVPAVQLHWRTVGQVMRRRLFTLLLAFVAFVRAERLPLKLYTAADGLAHNSLNRIVRDSRGYLWFCTSEGLSRFDGFEFHN